MEGGYYTTETNTHIHVNCHTSYIKQIRTLFIHPQLNLLSYSIQPYLYKNEDYLSILFYTAWIFMLITQFNISTCVTFFSLEWSFAMAQAKLFIQKWIVFLCIFIMIYKITQQRDLPQKIDYRYSKNCRYLK